MNLSSENLLAIKKTISESPISRASMRDNIIDHLCCAVEFKMNNGWDFEEAFAEAFHELAPNGLKEIEHETYLLLNIKTITMKKLTYLVGLVFSISTSLGIFFKLMHWPGASLLLVLGFGGLAIFFAPLLSFNRKREKSSFERKRDNIAIISMVLISIGSVLKVLHLVSANETLLAGTAVLCFGYLPMTFLKMYRESVAA